MFHTTITKSLLVAFALLAQTYAQTLPEGTPVPLRLEETISSGSAEKGQSVEFTVAEDVLSGDAVIFKQGARALGVVIEAEGKKRMGRAGKLDFTVEKVRAADGKY